MGLRLSFWAMNVISFDSHDYRQQAREQGLRYVSDNRPGYTRRRFGKSFVYFDSTGERIRDDEEIIRILRKSPRLARGPRCHQVHPYPRLWRGAAAYPRDREPAYGATGS